MLGKCVFIKRELEKRVPETRIFENSDDFLRELNSLNLTYSNEKLLDSFLNQLSSIKNETVFYFPDNESFNFNLPAGESMLGYLTEQLKGLAAKKYLTQDEILYKIIGVPSTKYSFRIPLNIVKKHYNDVGKALFGSENLEFGQIVHYIPLGKIIFNWLRFF